MFYCEELLEEEHAAWGAPLDLDNLAFGEKQEECVVFQHDGTRRPVMKEFIQTNKASHCLYNTHGNAGL